MRYERDAHDEAVDSTIDDVVTPLDTNEVTDGSAVDVRFTVDAQRDASPPRDRADGGALADAAGDVDERDAVDSAADAPAIGDAAAPPDATDAVVATDAVDVVDATDLVDARDAATVTDAGTARRCTTSSECSDGIACTYDYCSAGRCVSEPDQYECGAGQTCDPRTGCVNGRSCTQTSDCEDGDACTVSPYCSISARRCEYEIRDDDYDGVPPRACGGGDCNDNNSRVYPGAFETCDGIDNNCDGVIDEEEGSSALCPGGACVAGACTCTSGTRCSSRCVDLQSDANNCGSCGNYCSLSATCSGGRCVCAAGRTACGSSCIDLNTSYSNCGACGNACPFDQLCRAGRCECYTGEVRCGSACADPQSDEANCGACGNVCAGVGAVCQSGRCGCSVGIFCGSGSAQRCVDTARDATNCGACGNACPTGHVCNSGRCECPSTATTLCSGACVNTQTSASHCGACGRACTAPAGATATCVAGTCGLVCAVGRGDCDGNTANGCEADILTDSSNCGACRRSCPSSGACTLGACAGDEWLRAFGSTSTDATGDIAANAAGDIVITGSFSGSITLGANTLSASGVADVFLAQLDAGGSVSWARRLGGTGNDDAHAVAVDAAGNVYATGTSDGAVDLGEGAASGTGASIWLTSFTRQGALRWSRRYATSLSGRAARGLAVDAAGNVYVSARVSGAVDFGGGALDGGTGTGVVFSLDANGQHRWTTRFSGYDTNPYDVSITPAGEVAVAALFAGTSVVGATSITSNGGYDGMVALLTSTGGPRWVRNVGGSGDDLLFSVTADSAGNLYAAGRSDSLTLSFGGSTVTNRSTYDMGLVVSFDASSGARWARGYTAYDVGGASITRSAAGEIVVGGWFDGTLDAGGATVTDGGSYDGFVATLATDGTTRRVRRIGGSGGDNVLSVTPLGATVLAFGPFDASITLGATTVSPRGSDDLFLARIVP